MIAVPQSTVSSFITEAASIITATAIAGLKMRLHPLRDVSTLAACATRHIDKAVWELPIPEFDPANLKHVQIAELGEAEARRIADLKFDEDSSHIQIRPSLRDTSYSLRPTPRNWTNSSPNCSAEKKIRRG
ncbi:hypothetical protein [Streptomyces roseochromogenus]|uniref:Uncharacterized protein n=1 Tax=Streptomyces roseochromogenus subsp. oscitans DS 12.976 TaxID=1352936 RepID=V6K830_STRRC|nr:hypothetical protein [Streptomyces roseochromogenus]EST27586.1 hypothetical protein M878_24380 [Streptomyces roseochromogenus subsp. oscitans DS 12.976]